MDVDVRDMNLTIAFVSRLWIISDEDRRNVSGPPETSVLIFNSAIGENISRRSHVKCAFSPESSVFSGAGLLTLCRAGLYPVSPALCG